LTREKATEKTGYRNFGTVCSYIGIMPQRIFIVT